MISTVQAGRKALDRMPLYQRMAAFAPVRETYAGKFALAAFVGILIPLAVFIVYMLLSRSDWTAMYPVLAALVLACFMGFLGTMWSLRELLVPIDLTAEAWRKYIEKRELPRLPVSFSGRAGRR